MPPLATFVFAALPYTSWAPPDSVVPLAVPTSYWTPPLDTVVPAALPYTTWMPPLATVVATALPYTTSVPLPDTVALVAVPHYKRFQITFSSPFSGLILAQWNFHGVPP
jgi:hypothetical protein